MGRKGIEDEWEGIEGTRDADACCQGCSGLLWGLRFEMGV